MVDPPVLPGKASWKGRPTFKASPLNDSEALMESKDVRPADNRRSAATALVMNGTAAATIKIKVVQEGFANILVRRKIDRATVIFCFKLRMLPITGSD